MGWPIGWEEFSAPIDVFDGTYRPPSANGYAKGILLVTGTSAEVGDDGQVGRGNRVNGIITPGRPVSLEAAVGRNPVSHVGKIYNASLARDAAEAIVAKTAGFATRDGKPVADVRRRVETSLQISSTLLLRSSAVRFRRDSCRLLLSADRHGQITTASHLKVDSLDTIIDLQANDTRHLRGYRNLPTGLGLRRPARCSIESIATTEVALMQVKAQTCAV